MQHMLVEMTGHWRKDKDAVEPIFLDNTDIFLLLLRVFPMTAKV